MSAFPVTLDGSSISALVVGGGSVALRRAQSLAATGAKIHVVAPSIDSGLEALALANSRVRLTHSEYDASQLADINFVVAATDTPGINAAVDDDARANGILVNVADVPELGTCTIPAVHRAGGDHGDLVIAVSAGGVPAAAMRIRDEVGRIVDDRHGRAVAALVELRRSLLDRGERARWREAAEQLVGPDFLADVDSGRFSERLGAWR